MANCTICGLPVVLSPSAEFRARNDKSGHPPSYFTNLFLNHAHCVLDRRAEQSRELMAKHRDNPNYGRRI